MSLIIRWATRAWNYFWNNGGTTQEQQRQEGIVRTFASYYVGGAASAEITAPGHSGGTDPTEQWHITTRYYDYNNQIIHSAHGGAWHMYTFEFTDELDPQDYGTQRRQREEGGWRAKKAENEAKKQQSAEAEKERKEADAWKDDAKSAKSKEDKEAKRLAELARKAENARLLAEEEASAPSKPKAAPKAVKKGKVFKPAGPGAIAAGGGIAAAAATVPNDEGPVAPTEAPEEFTATGIDNAIDLLEVVTAKMDKASVGQQAAGLERHPERRFKASFEAYKEREMPNVRADHPGLRLQQYQEILFKQFQKSPENPFNQVTVAYDASKDDKVDALSKKRLAVEERLRASNDRSQ
ncbi:hypothetical protein EUX98_g3375 [Antrodiella citrinella]|uniref:DUF1014-domain-containing protein n=1 Tax=Antrodiella citrinella TaxID=2447956 RepID=A0A4S4MZG9_9APHY|nr:hypothetical protein EUX98_g3375 [Antrodiella citrinella]